MPASDLLYHARATVGGGHPGEVRTGDDQVRATLAVPSELGGSGAPGTNAEQLLAAAYAACFYTALEQAAQERQVALPHDFGVECQVGLGRRDAGFALDVQILVQGDGAVPELIERAQQLWPHGPGAAPQIRVAAAPATSR